VTPGARAAAAIAVLERQAVTQAPADLVAGSHFRANRYIGAKDRAAVAAIIYGVLRHRAQLDWWIAHAQRDVDTPVASDARSRVLAWLTISEAWTRRDLEAAFDGGRYRPAAISHLELHLADRLRTRTLDHPEQSAAVRRNVPEWIMPVLAASLGAGLESELAALAQPAPLDLRVNALKAERAAVQALLAASGIEAAPTRWSPWGLRVQGRPPLSAHAAYRDGLVEVQDEGSQLAALLVDARPGMRVCDFCAGAGGKTLALAATMQNRGHIDACDVEQRRSEAAVKRLRRAGVHNAALHKLRDERDPWLKRRAGSFERVLVDAPCTGTGTWRRNPDARWTLKDSDIAELVALQARILDSAARLVKPGGRLVYVTCSLLHAENEAQFDAFLARTPQFQPVSARGVWNNLLGPPVPHGVGDTARLAPGATGTDGFFVAICERKT
jgi:16S rRNA (cytosine967-C5)-methyltransferase